jgi:hypothetical protein
MAAKKEHEYLPMQHITIMGTSICAFPWKLKCYPNWHCHFWVRLCQEIERECRSQSQEKHEVDNNEERETWEMASPARGPRPNDIQTYRDTDTFPYHLHRELPTRRFLSHHRVPNGFTEFAPGKSERAHWRSQLATLPSFEGCRL